MVGLDSDYALSRRGEVRRWRKPVKRRRKRPVGLRLKRFRWK